MTDTGSGMLAMDAAWRGVSNVNAVVGWITSTCPTSSEGRETERVRVMGWVRELWVNFSKLAAKMSFAWETERVMDTQSPFGEMMVGFRPLVEANELKALAVSEDG